MSYNNLNYLKEVKHVQKLTQEKFDEYVYISYTEIHRILQKEGNFFKSYRTFLKYVSEPKINERIIEEEKRLKNLGDK
ncbi:MAG: hypothetical protein LBH92_01375 [Bacteroidales bacterium]|jgi:hypothetical protein|nr:hypothetical protein [Bacteroidales bacterium]